MSTSTVSVAVPGGDWLACGSVMTAPPDSHQIHQETHPVTLATYCKDTVCMYVHMYACVHVCMYVYMYVCMYVCILGVLCANFLLCPDPTSSSPTGSISSAIMSGTSISNTSREVASASTLELD